MKEKNGFTLAETMIVLVVLGVIAMVTVPALISKHTETANRTKIKKAMSVYDTALNKMVIENGIKSNSALYENANSFAPEGNCTNTAPYFRVSTTLNNNICTFKASDGTYWDISKINAPIIAFNEADLNNANAENRYQLVGHFDNTTGSLRVNDLQYETGDNKIALQKTYNYVNAVKGEGSSGLLCDESCKKLKQYIAKQCDISEYASSSCPSCVACSTKSPSSPYKYHIFDENSKLKIWVYNSANSISLEKYNDDGSVTAFHDCDASTGKCLSCMDWNNGTCPNPDTDGKYQTPLDSI